MFNRDPYTASPLETALEGMAELLEQGASAAEVAEAVTMHYRQILKKWRPVIDSLPTTLSVIGGDITVVSAALIGMINTINENEMLEREMIRYRRHRARSALANFQAYREAGFGRFAALVLTVVDAQKNPFQGMKYTHKQDK